MAKTLRLSQNLTCTQFLSPGRRRGVLTVRERYAMKLRMGLLLTIISCLAAVAQRGAAPAGRAPGGFPSGGLSSRWGQFPNSGWRSPGRGRFGLGRNPLTFYGPPVSWFGPPWSADPCALMFPTDPFSLVDNICYPTSYPMGPWGSSSADPAMPQLPPLFPPPPLLAPPPIGAGPASAPEPRSHANSAADHDTTHPTNEASTQAPAPRQEEYPALIVLKPGGIYSATKYWVKNKNLYFATTQGEVLYTPLSRVERLYPASKARQ